MGYEVAKLAVQSSSAAYSPLKDMILYFKNKAKYVKELEDNLTKLIAEMATFYSRKQQLDRVLERDVSKEKNVEYHILLKQFEVFHKKYNKFIHKYRKHCRDLPGVPEEQEVSTESKVAENYQIRDLDVSTISSRIEVLQTRKPTVMTRKFFKLATLSRDITKLHAHISRITDRMKAENVVLEKKVEPVQVKHDDVDLPSFTEYVQKILSYLSEDENRSIGILGPIGVGKTTVMKMLNNQLKDDSAALPDGAKSLKFEVVIWINYSKQSGADDKTIELMQDAIMGRLKLNKEKDNNIEQNADIISMALMHKKYILLIDQVSSAFEFDRVGIHKDHKFGKVVVASSSNKVITRMTDDRVEIRPLSPEDSLDLFQQVCGVIYDKHIKGFVKSIVESCGGLPHVIKLVAMHLKGEKDEQVWSDVKRILQSDPESVRLLKLGKIGNAYKLVYDNLEKSYKKCLLFAALFPSGYIINRDYLVECWNAERFLEPNISELRRARERGATVLKELTDQYLLENYSDMHVTMPVHFRTVALAQNYPDEEDNFFWAPQKNRVLDEETWETSKRMSLISFKSKLPECPKSHNMSTLLLQRNSHLETLGDLFFKNMEKLSILDLNQAAIKSLPSSISKLINLTCLYLNDCSLLGELPPEVKKMEKLEVLDIRGTSIQHLPDEVGDMSLLKCLRISFSQSGCNRKGKGKEVEMTVPPYMISRLKQLEELVIEAGCCSQGWNAIVDQLIDELICLEKLNTLSFHFPSASCLKKFVTKSRSLNNVETRWGTNTFRSFKISVGCCEMQHPYGADISGIFGERLLRVSNNEEISSVGEVLRQASSFELVGHSDVESLSEFNLENTGALKVCILEKCKKLSCVVDVSKIDDKQVDSSGQTHYDILQCLEKLHLFELQLFKCLWKGSIFPGSLANLKVLTLFDCPELTEILSPELAKALSSLEHLKVEKCLKIVEIVKTQIPVMHFILEIVEQCLKNVIVKTEIVDLSDILHKVKTVELVNLPQLQSICKSTTMNWKSLRKIEIISCDKLKNLRSILRDGGKLHMIKCEAKWWDALVLPKEEKEKLLSRCKFIVLEQPLPMVALHKAESFNHGKPADPQPSDTILNEGHDKVTASNENDLSVSAIDSVVHEYKHAYQDQDELTLYGSNESQSSSPSYSLPDYKPEFSSENNLTSESVTGGMSSRAYDGKIPEISETEIGKRYVSEIIEVEEASDSDEQEDTRLHRRHEKMPIFVHPEVVPEDSKQTDVFHIPLENEHELGMGIPISVTGKISTHVELRFEILSSSQEMLNLSKSFGLDPEMDKYFFSATKVTEVGGLEQSGTHEMVQANGSLLPEYLVVDRSGSGSDKMPTADEWHQAGVINLSGKNFLSLNEEVDFPNLVLLFLQRNNGLSHIPSSFFDRMPALRFLDLSYSRISVSGLLASSLFKLSNLQVLMLRSCVCLDSLPAEVENLHNMELLDLSSTDLYSLPEEIGQLKRLRQLRLSFYGPDYGSGYSCLPQELVSPSIFSELKDLEVLSIVVHPEDQRWIRIADDIIDYVRRLENLTNLEFYFPSVEAFNSFVDVSPSWKKLRIKRFKFIVGHNVKRIISRVPDEVESNYDGFDQCLRFINGNEVPESMKTVLMSVKAFYLDHHLDVQNLSEFGISNFKELKFCVMGECPKIQVMMVGEKSSESAAFPKLEHLEMHYLWELQRIWEGPVQSGSFEALKFLTVDTCPKLEYIASYAMLQCLSNLETLIIEDCESLKSIVEENNTAKSDSTPLLPRLAKLVLLHLPELATLGTGLYPSEKIITHQFCPMLILSRHPGKTKRRKLLGSPCSICIS